jgi:signal transduction histidine kinase
MSVSEVISDLGFGAVASTQSVHRVQFYNHDEYLLSSVAEHLAGALVSGGVGLAFVTAPHREQICERLHAAGVPDEIVENRCVLVDASYGLSRFMRSGFPDRRLFTSTVGELLAPLSAAAQGVAAFGEMVALLWAEGKYEAAIQLEQLWTDFTTQHAVQLLCAYPLSYFSRAEDGPLFARVCAHHSSVVPAESFMSGIVEEDQAREVAELQQRAEALAKEVEARKRAEARLRAHQVELESIVQQRTAALRKLSLQVLKLQDIERRRVARELHESVGQDFAGLKMNLDLVKHFPHNTELWEKCDELLEHCIHEVRTLSNLLHPPIIEDAGLPSAVEWYVQDFAKRSGIQVNAHRIEVLSSLSDPARLVVFRAMQESLINVYRHARATQVEVSAIREENSIILTVADNGIGIDSKRVEQFNSSGTSTGVGLTSIRERVRELGGHCHVSSSPQGTNIKISVPLS